MHFRKNRRNATLLNVTPLIDVVFILLVFFMLTTNFGRFRLIGVETPQDREVLRDATAAVVIRIEDDGALTYDGKPSDVEDIAAQVANLTAVDPGRSFIVRPAEGVSVQEAIDIFQLTRHAGASLVSFSKDLEATP